MERVNAEITNTQSLSIEANPQTLTFHMKNDYYEMQFPLFHAIFQHNLIPIIFGYPFLIMYFAQCILVSTWPWMKYMEDYRNNELMSWLFRILFFMDRPTTDLNYLYASLPMWFCALLSIVFIQIQMQYYKYQRKFINLLNYPIRLYYDTALPWFYMPAMIGFCETGIKICKGYFSATLLVAFLLYLSCYIYMIISFLMVQQYAAKTIYIAKGPLFNFDPRLMVRMLWFDFTTISVFFILTLFEYWAPIAAVVVHMVAFFYLGYYMLSNDTFVDVLFQSMGVAWHWSCAIGDFVTILRG